MFYGRSYYVLTTIYVVHNNRAMATVEESIGLAVPFRSLGERAAVSLGVAAGCQGRAVERIMARHGLTATQYNVLRILRGQTSGLMYPTTDLTRLVDRLASRGMIIRTESSRDRRVRTHRITHEGLRTIDRIQPDLDVFHARLESALGPEALGHLAELCGLVVEELTSRPTSGAESP